MGKLDKRRVLFESDEGNLLYFLKLRDHEMITIRLILAKCISICAFQVSLT